jgi:small conductance mechanosensitive channel
LTIVLGLSLIVQTVKAQADLEQSASESAKAPEEDGLVQEAQELVEKIEKARQGIAELKAELSRAKGEDRAILQRQISDRQMEGVSNIFAFCENVLEQEEKGLDASAFRQKAELWLKQLGPAIRQHVESLQDAIVQMRNKRDSVSPEELVAFEAHLAKGNARMDELYEVHFDCIVHMEALGLEAQQERSSLAEDLSDRAEIVAGQIKLTLEQVAGLQVRLNKDADNAALQDELTAAEHKLDRTTKSMTAMVQIMDELDLDTADYKQLLITATGDITGDIFDTEVALGLFEQWMGGIREWAVENGPRFLFKAFLFLLILLIFKVLARLTRKVVEMSMAKSKLKFTQLLQNMFVSVASKIVMLLGLLVALSQLGLEIGPLLAGLGVAGFIIGFALQDTLSNFASGMMILIYRPYDVGDLIEAAGVFGKVSDMNLVSTTILTIDNQTLVVPNSKIWGDVIKNVTAQHIRRVDMVFGISYGDDIPQAEKVLQSILAEHEKVLEDPEPMVKVHTLGNSSVDLIVRPWVKTVDYWDVYWDVTREVKMRFDKEGICIPFPQRDVHFYMERSEEKA